MSSFDMVITIRYSPTKSAQLLDLSRKEIADILRADLDFLKLPHPPVDNITGPAADSSITFWWTTKRNTVSRLSICSGIDENLDLVSACIQEDPILVWKDHN